MAATNPLDALFAPPPASRSDAAARLTSSQFEPSLARALEPKQTPQRPLPRPELAARGGERERPAERLTLKQSRPASAHATKPTQEIGDAPPDELEAVVDAPTDDQAETKVTVNEQQVVAVEPAQRAIESSEPVAIAQPGASATLIEANASIASGEQSPPAAATSDQPPGDSSDSLNGNSDGDQAPPPTSGNGKREPLAGSANSDDLIAALASVEATLAAAGASASSVIGAEIASKGEPTPDRVKTASNASEVDKEESALTTTVASKTSEESSGGQSGGSSTHEPNGSSSSVGNLASHSVAGELDAVSGTAPQNESERTNEPDSKLGREHEFGSERIPADAAAAVEVQLADSVESSVADPNQPAPQGDASTSASTAAAAASRGATALERLGGSHLSHSAQPTADRDGAAPVDRNRFLQRVEGAFKAARERDGRIQVRLSPPELGVLRIELVMQNGALTARIEAETQAARTTLLDNLPALRERLAQQEIRIDKFDVDLRRDGAGSGGAGGQQSRDGHADQSAFHDDGRRSRLPSSRQQTTTSQQRPATAPRSTSPNTALDVRI